MFAGELPRLPNGCNAHRAAQHRYPAGSRFRADKFHTTRTILPRLNPPISSPGHPIRAFGEFRCGSTDKGAEAVPNPRPVLAYPGTGQRNPCSRCSLPSVSRPAVLPKLNLRGRYCATVLANGCLAKLLLWPPVTIVSWSSATWRFEIPSAGDLRLPLTPTYHGCPRVLSPVFAAGPTSKEGGETPQDVRTLLPPPSSISHRCPSSAHEPQISCTSH